MPYRQALKTGGSTLCALLLALCCFHLSARAMPTPQTEHVLSEEVLANATYTTDFTADGTVTLVDGEFEAELAPGSASTQRVILDDTIAYGDLNGDGVEDAAVILVATAGGSGTFYNLAAVLDDDGEPFNAAIELLGDRVDIEELSIADGLITVNMITQGPDDPMCCPSQAVTQTYALQDNALIMLDDTGNAMPEPTSAMTTTEHVLSEEVLANATYTTDFTADGTFTLVEGEFEAELAPDSASTIRVVLDDTIAYGDLNGDGVEDAAVILVATAGGSGTFYNLAAVLDDDGEPLNAAIELLGDRVDIEELSIADGLITVNMITQGPDDPMCCPSQAITQTYALQDNALIVLDDAGMAMFEPTREITTVAEFSPDAPPNVATIELGGTDDIWLDPMLVSVLSGVLEGESVDVDGLGEGCAGFVSPRPDVVLNWKEDEAVDELGIFFLSNGDPTLTVVTPDGTVLCNDDLNPLVLDPFISIPDPAEGRYAIFVGSFEQPVHAPGFVVFTSRDYTPATLDLGQLFPREVAPAAVGDPIPRSALLTEREPEADPSSVALQDGFESYSQEMSGGGSLGAFNIDLGNQLCTGFIDAIPTFAFEWSGTAERLRVFFESNQDSTLLIQTPNGSFACNDDHMGSNNLNPVVDIVPVEGEYLVYVGSFSPSETVSGTLTIAESTDVEPTPLSSDMLPEGE